MHSVHVLYCLQSGSVEPREKDKPQLNKDTEKWNVSPAPKLKKQKVKKRKRNNKRASFFFQQVVTLLDKEKYEPKKLVFDTSKLVQCEYADCA